MQDYPELLVHDQPTLPSLAYNQAIRQRRQRERHDIQIRNEPSLALLAAHLDKSAPFPIADPEFRKTLEDKLLRIQEEFCTPETLEMTSDNRSETTSSGNQELILPLKDQDSVDLELATLIGYLDATALSVVVDPEFRKALREKILGIQAEYYASVAAKSSPDNVNDIADKIFQDPFLACIAHEVVNFPDEQRIALLIDLASRTKYLDVGPLQLEQAFLQLGIRLQDYEPLLPQDPIASRRHAFFLSLAYKRVAELLEVLLEPGEPFCINGTSS